MAGAAAVVIEAAFAGAATAPSGCKAGFSAPMRLLLPLLILLCAAAPARAATGPCLPGGPACHFWYVKAVGVGDGDTIFVHIGGAVRKVRVTAIQAMEQTVYSTRASKRRGECHSLEATARMEQLLRAGHWRVRLAAQDPASHAGARLRRSVAVRLHGRWVDTGERLIREGHALWMPGIVETAWNARYALAQQQARRAGRNLWNPVQCGRGPAQDAPLRVWAQSDPSGVDAQHVNDEWIKVYNPGATAVSLRGWWVRTAEYPRYHFPPSATLPAGGTVTVHAGHGSNTATDFFWGFDVPIFENAGDARHLGGGAYLFDPQGDLRAAFTYPCLLDCGDPNAGALTVAAHPRTPESVLVRNVSSHAVDLYGYEVHSDADAYEFPPGAVLAPGAFTTVRFEGAYRMPDGGGAVRLQRFDGVVLACDAWGSGRC
jgi:endonuclease YncB( thermonuclease family)